VDNMKCAERLFAARATAISASGWNARIEDTADVYSGLGQGVPKTDSAVVS
jgi:hypothetical protein